MRRGRCRAALATSAAGWPAARAFFALVPGWFMRLVRPITIMPGVMRCDAFEATHSKM